MLYAILAYHVETEVMSWTPEEDAALMVDLHKVHDRLTKQGRLGPAARLGETGKARTLRGPGAGVVIDGPFAETKEQLLGFYVVDCASEDAAIEAARDLRRVNPTAVYEIRPIMVFLPGTGFPRTEAASDGD
ncbi:YciI family protein [Bradyrhizobium cenepequi]|uniref:YciI family protein n=1 Tax=Bradyrhizobium cenepequi TaxID=2821403 RepID=UPI001CE31A25|nr:YciI family protein [Bradyrhizobium cenepequi]MCA6109783.1 YciI family protein [Bradyrhizobium cenepequi]